MYVGAVHAETEDSFNVADYDANGNGSIDKSEVLKAINDYLFGDAISKAEVLQVIDSYLFNEPIPEPTPGPTPAPAPTPATGPRLTIHNTQNMRWLAQSHPSLYRRIAELPWVEDGLIQMERDAIDQLLYIGVGDIPNLEAVLWFPWVRDDISAVEYDVLYWMEAVGYEDAKVTAAIIPMQFLRVPDASDVLALRSIHTLARKGALAPLVDHPAFQDGLTEGLTTLVAAVGTMFEHPDEISRMLDPGYASIESFSITTHLTPLIFVNIVGVGGASHPHAADAIANAGAFVERAMLLPLPIEHLILVLNDNAVSSGAAGTNYGFAFGYRPKYEGRRLMGGIVHEVAHYYWRGSEGWVDEGLANTIEHMHGIANGLSPGQMKAKRKGCEAHDLEMLSQWDPPVGSPEYDCNYYLGDRLFLDLREGLDDAEFSEKLRELYQLTLEEKEIGGTPGIAAVRQVFADQDIIIDKHWSGKMNAPENRPFDEGQDRTMHDLIQWDQHPAHDGHSVTFSGTLRGSAVLSNETMEQARAGGEYANFTLYPADGYGYAGSILPPLKGGWTWTLDDPGDTVATAYELDDGAFTVTFPFPEAFDRPADYVVLVWGFQDASRTPTINDSIDILGYARIRVP